MIESEARPDPEALLERVNREEEQSRRAKLKIFFGFAPGVGKTYAMLESARALADEGVDVVVGYVETHGREETVGLLDGLEILPRRPVTYRGVQLEELDLDAALARRPAVLLVDELAHTNAPGSRHVKRWQDVLEILDAGIDVHTTLNVQHVESLNDVIAQITTVRVRETVPDSVLDRADEIELIDLTPDELLDRLREGKVYIPDQARHAAGNFFRKGNLHTLRELALRRTADRVDADVRAWREAHAIDVPWAASERILACIGPGAGSASVLRAARRTAAALHAPWVAATVEIMARTPLSEEDRARLESHIRLAETLGAEVARLPGNGIAETIVAYARKRNVTRILVGRPTRGRWRDLLRGSLVDQLVRRGADIDVQVVAREDAAPAPARTTPSIRSPARNYGSAAIAVAIATGLSALGSGLFDQPDVVMLYILAIMISGVRFGRGPSLFAAALSVATFDLFFVPPFLTFAISDARFLLTFAMMFAVGWTISTLTSRLRFQETAARLREERAAALLALSKELGEAIDQREVARATCAQILGVFDTPAAILLPSEGGTLQPAAEAGAIALDAQDLAVAHWAFDLGKEAGHGTDTLPGSRVRCIPLEAGGPTLGVLAVLPQSLAASYERPHHELLEAFARQSALALERSRLAEEARSAVVRARTEEMRSSLLSAVSHDLRTPLAAITGAATTIRDSGEKLADRERTELLDTISDEAMRLERLVANLLDMTRIESGGIEPKSEWIPLEEIVGSALSRLDRELAGRSVSIDLPESLPLVSVDPILFGQALVNLLENAAKHTPVGTPIEIRAKETDGEIVLSIADRGPGLPEEPGRLFEKFARGTRTTVSGAGLGLAIARGIVEAHGGRISAANRDGGGAIFTITLHKGAPPA